MRALTWLFQRTLNSVPFGIAILVAIAAYIAVGSGVVSLREWLEMDELLFFNWWPFKVLIVLLVANLVTVTVIRIPLTPPRYGVWSIHMGIILLVMSLSAYYSLKQEGLVPLRKGELTSSYYDRWDRALYVRTQFSRGPGVPLDGLPRFHEYDPSLGNGGYLDRSAFRDLSLRVRGLNAQTKQPEFMELGAALGLPDPVKIDVVGYYPYGVAERYRIDESVKNTGLRIRIGETMADEVGKPPKPGDEAVGWLVASSPLDAIVPLGPAVLEHRHLPTKAEVDFAAGAAKRLHKLTITTAGKTEQAYVEPGEELTVGDYTIHVEGFTPQFELSDGSGRADMLTVHVTRNAAAAAASTQPSMLAAAPATQPASNEYRRTILSGTNVQTDFELNVADAGPFGKRKRDGLLDNDLQLGYAFNDPTKLLPTMESATVKYLLFTADDTRGMTLLRVSSRDGSIVTSGEDHVNLRIVAPSPMLGQGGEQEIVRLNVERIDHLAPSSGIIAVPKTLRQSESARGGDRQMLRVRVSCGNWSGEFAVPYAISAFESAWPGAPSVKIPGASGEFQLCLGNARLPMDRAVRLEKFEPVPYAGGDTSRPGVMRDFRSTISIIDPQSGETQTQTTSLNNPAFFEIPSGMALIPGRSWLLSQASWNPNDHDQTTLQLGNRPGVGMMVFACCLIFGGLLYAFYAKPIIIRRMKANALRRAMEKKQQRPIADEASGPLAPVLGSESYREA